MAIGDLTAEQQVLQALFAAQLALLADHLTEDQLADVLGEIRQAIKRVQEATGQ
jgi:hypothetical protein